jgi:hypothetical protein
MANVVVGMFDDNASAHRVVDRLSEKGFSNSAVSVIGPEGNRKSTDEINDKTEASAGAGIGATIGAIAGASGGILASLALIAIPGIGPLLAAGPIVVALTGAGLGAAAGGLAGALIGWGIPAEDAELYSEGVRRGGTIVSVQADSLSQADEVSSLMRTEGAVDIDERASQWRAEGWTPTLNLTSKPPAAPITRTSSTRNPSETRDVDSGSSSRDNARSTVNPADPDLDVTDDLDISPSSGRARIYDLDLRR